MSTPDFRYAPTNRSEHTCIVVHVNRGAIGLVWEDPETHLWGWAVYGASEFVEPCVASRAEAARRVLEGSHKAPFLAALDDRITDAIINGDKP